MSWGGIKIAQGGAEDLELARLKAEGVIEARLQSEEGFAASETAVLLCPKSDDGESLDTWFGL